MFYQILRDIISGRRKHHSLGLSSCSAICVHSAKTYLKSIHLKWIKIAFKSLSYMHISNITFISMSIWTMREILLDAELQKRKFWMTWGSVNNYTFLISQLKSVTDMEFNCKQMTTTTLWHALKTKYK